MIDYDEIYRYYKGTITTVTENVGGIFGSLGEEKRTLLYKIDRDHYVDVNDDTKIAQVFRKGEPVTSHYILFETSLVPVKDPMDMALHSSRAKRLAFNPRKYDKK